MPAKTGPLQSTPTKTTGTHRRVTSTFFITLDGVVENPAWSAPYWNDEVRAFKEEESKRTEALLLGRRTYEMFAKAWPNSADEGAPFFNNVKKYVLSNTRTKDIWKNATFLSGDVKTALKKLKQEPGGELTVHGSVSVARWLIKEGLLDELRLLIYPVAVGKGERLFDGDGLHAEFELQSGRALSNGVLALVYRPKKP